MCSVSPAGSTEKVGDSADRDDLRLDLLGAATSATSSAATSAG
jgi:hypothetical protein